jgi:hypothetical protein
LNKEAGRDREDDKKKAAGGVKLIEYRRTCSISNTQYKQCARKCTPMYD